VGQHVRIAIVTTALALAACGRKPPRPEPLVLPTPAQAPPVDLSARYAPDGSLKSSGMRVEWLELPMGFTRVLPAGDSGVAAHAPDRESFEAELLPFEKVRDFFSKRMFTGKVEAGPYYAIYPAVMPLDMNESAPRLNVALGQSKGTIKLTIERVRPPPEVKPLSDDEARALLRQEAERMH
jgi:predicted small lipoprotein YifL